MSTLKTQDLEKGDQNKLAENAKPVQLQQFYFKTNENMTALTLNFSINKIQSLASSLAPLFTPFFFVKQNPTLSLQTFGRLSVRINNQMTPSLLNLPSSAKLGFWSASQFLTKDLPQKTLSNSIIINPYKTESLIKSALINGVRRMLVSDIEEVAKIQKTYFHLKRKLSKAQEPELIWSVEDLQTDLENLVNLQRCSLPFSGVYFGAQTTLKQISFFLENDSIKNKKLLKYKEISIENLDLSEKALRNLEIEPMVTNYSQIEDYVMICRVLGKDRHGKAVFDEACSKFVCKNQACTCFIPRTKIIEYFSAGGFDWVIIKPTRLDKMTQEHIYE